MRKGSIISICEQSVGGGRELEEKLARGIGRRRNSKSYIPECSVAGYEETE